LEHFVENPALNVATEKSGERKRKIVADLTNAPNLQGTADHSVIIRGSNMKLNRPRVIVPLSVLACIAIGLSLTLPPLILSRMHTPPNKRSHISSLDSWCRDRTEEIKISIDGNPYTVVFGTKSIFPFTERPPGYVFDSDGYLVDWSAEATDDDRLRRFWKAAGMK
jgi:hypothetical protein